MKTGIKIREACSDDNIRIADLVSRVAMPGPIEMTYHYEQSFFDAIEVEGYNPKVIVGEMNNQIVGVGTITTRNMYIDGMPMEAGYIASLRFDQSIRGASLLARGYRLFSDIHKKELGLPFYLTAIMKNNSKAIEILTSGRAGLPTYRFLAGFKTAVIPVLKMHTPSTKINIVRGNVAGPDVIMKCIEQFGRRKDYFTVYKLEHLLSSSGMLKGMLLDDFFIAYHESEIVGMVAAWDQSCFKKQLVNNYSGIMYVASMCSNIVKKFTGITILPPKGISFAPIYLSCIAIKNNSTEIFQALLIAVLNHMKIQKKMLLVAGFFEDDKLNEVINSFYHLSFYSNIYSVSWDIIAPKTLGKNPEKFIDVGSL